MVRIRSRVTFSTAALAATAIAVIPYLDGAATAQAKVPAAMPTTGSWYGDPKAPDLSGVWVRVETPAGTGNKEGWLPWPPPLKPAFAAIWRKRVADAAAGTRTDDPVRGCLPPGMPRFMTGMTGPLLIVQTPGRVMLYRDGVPVRRIWLDGHPNPPAKDLESFFGGNAIGRYQSNDLVTEVVGIKDQPIDATGVPHSDDLKVVERFHRVDAKTLRVDVTLTDPKAYLRPMTSSVTYAMYGDPLWEPHEFLCKPNTDFHPERYVK